MEVFDKGFREDDQNIMLNGIRGIDDLPTMASDAFTAMYQTFEAEDTFFSRERNFTREAEERNKRIAALTGEDSGDWRLYEEINPRELKQLQNDLSVLQNENDPLLRLQASNRLSKNQKAYKAWQSLHNLRQKYPEIEDDDQLFDNIQKTILEKRQAAQKAQENATTFGGKAGAVAGTLVAAMKQPETLVTLPIGFGGLGGAKTAWQVLGAMTKAGAAEGALSAGTELAIQPEVFQYKQEIDADYTLADSAKNVGFAAVGGATFGFLLRGVAELPITPRQRLLDELKTRNPDQAQRDAIDIAEAAEEIARQSPFPSRDVNAMAAHHKAYEKARQDLATDSPVDVRPYVKDYEPPLTIDAIRQEKSILQGQREIALKRNDSETVNTIDQRLTNLDDLEVRFEAADEIQFKETAVREAPVLDTEQAIPAESVRNILKERDINLPRLGKDAEGHDVIEYSSTKELFDELDKEKNSLEAIKVCSLS